MCKLLLSFTLIALSAVVVSACECQIGMLKRDFREAREIFVGETITISTQQQLDPKISNRPLYAITFRIEKKWKGPKRKEVTVLTDSCASMCCLVRFEAGKKYLVYVYDYSLVPSDCALSAEIGSDRAERNMGHLDSFWFRLKARLWRL